MVNDTIADMLTRIRNANQMRYNTVSVYNTTITKRIAAILKEEGYITDFSDNAEDKKMLDLTLKYGDNKKERVITGLKRISKPGLRVYAKHEDLPRVLNGLGIAIISTSKGIMTDKKARENKLGGEVLAYIW